MYEISARISGLWDNYAHKLLCILKITTIILLVSIAPLQASNVFGQRINYAQKQVSLEQLFKEIKKQTYYNVVWFDDNLNTKATLDVDFKNATIEEVMDRITSNQLASYQIKNKTIIIKWKAPSTGEKLKKTILNFFEALIDVTGRVVDERGDPLPGAKVRVNGPKQITTSTNASGDFTLKGIADNATITISFIGYESKELPVSASMGAIKLAQSDAKLEEVEINAGYYTVKDRERTGSISRVTAETISKQPISNPLEALIGRMPGVNITQNSGVPGGGLTVEIRGRNSLRATGAAREPLYLVDGIPYPSVTLSNSDLGVTSITGASPLNYISPNDIESVEVLKDADATAIYGSRGANGVILIKTKSAKTGKTTFNINANSGVSVVGRKLNLLDTKQYLEMRNEAFANDGINPASTDYDVNGAWDKDKFTDWQKVLIGGTASNSTLGSSLTGGNEFTQFVFRGNYSKQTSVFPDKYADQKGSGTLTVNHRSLNNKFKANFSSAYALDHNSLPTNDLVQNIILAPNAPDLYDINGELNWALNSSGVATWTNPLSYIHMSYLGRSNTMISNGNLSYEVSPGLFLKTNVGYSNIRLNENTLTSIKAFSPTSAPTGQNFLAENSIDTWIIEPQLNYQKELGKGMLDVLLGSTFQKDQQKGSLLAGLGYTSDALLESITAAPVRSGASNSSEYRYNAIFGRINYAYQNAYIINITGRRDGSSRFGPDRQFANFGAVGLAWIFTNKINSLVGAISFGKIRGSYGITGSDQIDNYGYMDTYSASNPYQDGTGLIPTRLANPDYSWETNKKFEVAMDLGFFNDKILLSTSFYRNRSSNQLVGYSLPDITGFAAVQFNLPATVQNSGLEFELSTTNLKKSSFSWNSSFNLSVPWNKLVSFPNLKGTSYASSYTVGKSIYTPIGYHYLDVNSQNGLYTFEDLNGNGNDLDAADKAAANKALGRSLYGGIQNSVLYKHFQLDVFFQFARQIARDPLTQFGNPGTLKNQPIDVLGRWRKIGDETEIQKFSQSTIAGGAGIRYNATVTSDKFVDASFIRLKNISFSWTAPTSWINAMKLNNLKVYVQGQNVLVLTRYLADPDVLSPIRLPLLTTITAGLQLGI